MRASRRVALAVATAAAVAAAVTGTTLPVVTSAAEAPCPPGYRPVGRGHSAITSASVEDRLRDVLDRQAPGTDTCVSLRTPENPHELSLMAREQSAKRTAPLGAVREGAYASALVQRKILAQASIPGTGGTWEPVGEGPLYSADEPYPNVNGLGLRELAGRIQDFSYDAEHGVVYVSVAGGGVYKSSNLGDTWVDVSATLPNLTVASVTYAAGTLHVLTGDSNGGGNSYAGTGAYYSTDGGATWEKSEGVPEGLLGFRVAHDPTNPSEVYAATGGGLFRSLDAGRTYENVNLPTGSCAGAPAENPCFFANQVTDVVIQSPDDFGNTGGRVVAAVGWRAGTFRDRSGEVQAPGNGLYGSDTGDPDSFERIDTPGPAGIAATQDEIGRIELGTTDGPDQDHKFLYAIVQDAVKFNGGVPVTDANETAGNPAIGYNTVLGGIYVSHDFGVTWIQMEDGDLAAGAVGANGSSLGVGNALAFGPGVQAWYNQFIKPDPTRTDPTTNAPTRLLFGLEEVWENEETTVPQIGPSSFHVIGRYFSDQQCGILAAGRPPGVPCETDRLEPSETTTHPDQHGIIYIPGTDEGSVHLLVGNDGGVYRQSVAVNEEFEQTNWGDGIQDGFHTLLPYGVAVARDGTVWTGLQDNGHVKITPQGRQSMTYGGDGTWALVDPEDSNVAYEATPNAAMNFTTDGGTTWSGTDPGLTGAAFITQFEMDPLDSDHLVVGGREVKEKLDGPTGGGWTTVFDLGTVDNPGTAPSDTDMSVINRVSGIDVVGSAVYAGFCGQCDVVTGAGEFASGIATNVGGESPPEPGTSDGWHIATGTGLPERYVNSVTIDPDDPRTVYVTLGGYSRRWVPPGANAEDASAVGEGHLYKSTDAGETFTDISGDLPDVPANWLVVRGSQLLVGTDFGVFASTNRGGGPYGLLGAEFDLPMAPVVQMVMRPGNDKEMYVSTFGRGIYKYTFADGPVGPVTPTLSPSPLPRPTPPKPLPSTGNAPVLPVAAAVAAAAAVALAASRRLATARRPS